MIEKKHSRRSTKYPKGKRLLFHKRLLRQIVLLLLVVCGAGFYFFIHSDSEHNSIFEQLGQSLVVPSALPKEKKERPKEGTVPSALPPDRRNAPSPRNPSSIAIETKTPPLTPFASMSLDQLAAAMEQRYANVRPTQWGEHLPGITTHLDKQESRDETKQHPVIPQQQGHTYALTLDACGGKKDTSYDAGIIALLRELNIPAVIFVTNQWVQRHEEILKELANDALFEIGAHGARHLPCSVNGKSAYGIKGTASVAELVHEVEGNARAIAKATGKRPRWFRAGTAYYDDVAVKVIHDLGLRIAGYTVAGDEGATLPAWQVASKTLAAKDRNILLYHLNHPQSGTREGLKKSLPWLLKQGCVFVRLPDK